MATLRLTAGSVLGTVEKAATTLTSTIDVLSTGVGMINARVQQAAEAQRKTLLIEAETEDEEILDRVSLEQAQRRVQIEELVSRNPQLEKHFGDARKRYASILASANQKKTGTLSLVAGE